MDGIHSSQNVVYKALVKLLKTDNRDRYFHLPFDP